jgi:hypothetical protein
MRCNIQTSASHWYNDIETKIQNTGPAVQSEKTESMTQFQLRTVTDLVSEISFPVAPLATEASAVHWQSGTDF